MTDDVVDSLYALPLDEFVSARNDAAKRARREGDTVTATRLTSLTKPTVAAWTVNQVVRQFPDDIDALLGIGAEMRAATAARDGAALAELNKTRRIELDAFVSKATKSGTVAGRSVSGDTVRKVGETLEAAIIDPEAGDAVASGTLTQALQHVGFGVVDEAGTPAEVVSLSEARASRRPGLSVVDDAPSSGVGAENGSTDSATSTEQALAEAEHEVEAATAELDRLEGARDDAAAAARETTDALAELRADLDRVVAEIAELDSERDRLASAVDDAQTRADRAERAARALDDDIAAAERRAEAARKRRRETRAAHR